MTATPTRPLTLPVRRPHRKTEHPDAAASHSELNDDLVLDPERVLHDRYGAVKESLYVVRPDGYVGYRSEPATASAFNDYLVAIFGA